MKPLCRKGIARRICSWNAQCNCSSKGNSGPCAECCAEGGRSSAHGPVCTSSLCYKPEALLIASDLWPWPQCLLHSSNWCTTSQEQCLDLSQFLEGKRSRIRESTCEKRAKCMALFATRPVFAYTGTWQSTRCSSSKWHTLPPLPHTTASLESAPPVGCQRYIGWFLLASSLAEGKHLWPWLASPQATQRKPGETAVSTCHGFFPWQWWGQPKSLTSRSSGNFQLNFPLAHHNPQILKPGSSPWTTLLAPDILAWVGR